MSVLGVLSALNPLAHTVMSGNWPQSDVDANGLPEYSGSAGQGAARPPYLGTPGMPPGSWNLLQSLGSMRLDDQYIGRGNSASAFPANMLGVGGGTYVPTAVPGPMGPRLLDTRMQTSDVRLATPPGPRGYYQNQNGFHGGPSRDGVHVPARHQVVEINLNKAITKKLASAVHYQKVLDVVAESVDNFDEVNVATALHRLAKLQPPNSSGQQSPIVYTEQFQQLVFAIKRLLHRFEAQAVSNTMWAFATLSYYPDNDLLDKLGHHAAGIIATFRPQATSNTLWAYAKLGYTPCEALLRAAAAQMTIDLSKSVPQDISNGLWAYATLRQYPGPGLLNAAARQAATTIRNFKPQEIANTLWSYATLGHDPGNALLDAMAIQMVERIQQFRSQAISNSLWAYAKLGYNPGKELLAVTSRRAQTMLHQYTSQEVANTLWAVATLEHNPGVALLDAAAVQILRRIDQFSPQDTSNSIWALAKLYHHPSSELLQASAMYTLRHWHRFKVSEAVNILWALAVLRGCSPETWAALLEKLAAIPVNSFDEADLQRLYQTFMLLEGANGQMGAHAPYTFPQALLDASIQAYAVTAAVPVAPVSRQLHEEVSQALWSMGVQHQNEFVTTDGLFTVDIFLPESKVVIEVDDPSHYSSNVARPMGPVLARRNILESRGFVVRTVPFMDWNALQNLEQQKGYLRRLLGVVGPHTLPGI